MNDDDLGKTMIIPNPGGRRKSTGVATPPPQSATPQSQPTATSNQPYSNHVDSENVLLSSASQILILAGNIRSLEPSYSVEQLRQDIENLIETFDTQLEQHQLTKEVALTARYLICCLIDELVLATPWGSESSWSHQTLLSKYHNETSGGQKFFLIVDKLLEQPQRNIDLIELCFVCLSAGFCGKYRVSQQCEVEISQVSQRLYQPIEQSRPIDRDLSPKWQGTGETDTGFVRKFPSIIYFLLLGFLILAIYIGFLSSLKTKVEPLYEKIESIGWNEIAPTTPESEAENLDVNAIVDFYKLALQPYIDSQILAVEGRGNIVIVRFTSTTLFGSGSSVVNERVLPDVNVLVNAIKAHVDNIIVVGHTDSTGKADSNWVISRKRAEAIARWLDKSTNRMGNTITRGVADTQPLVADDGNAYNRSINRRVELILPLKG